YLPNEVVFDTLRYVASLPPGGGIVFDYSLPRASLGFFQKTVFDRIAKRVENLGEPFIGFFEPSKFAADLKATGFSEIEDLSQDDLNARYFRDRDDALK